MSTPNKQTGKRVLIVSSHPSHPTDAGNRAAIMAQANILTSLGIEVHFLFADMSLKKHDYSPMQNYWGDNFHIFHLSFLRKIWRNYIDFIRPRFCHGYWKIDDHYPSGLAQFVNHLDNELHFDGVIIQYIRLSKLFNSITIPRKAVFTHDVFSYKDIRTGQSFYETCNAHEEAKGLQRCDNIFAIQEEEAVYFRYLSPNSKIYTVFNPYQTHQQSITHQPRILFLASRMSFNVLGIQWFLDNVWPSIRQQLPAVELLIAGTVCEKIDGSAYTNVKLFGRVDSLDEFYQSGDIVINPVHQGTGLKIKTFEALAYGKATIVHPHSTLGIFDKSNAPILKANCAEDWVRYISEILNGKINLQQMQKESIHYIERMNDYIANQYKSFLG